MGRKVLLRNFVEGIEVVDDAATLTYIVPLPADGVTRERVPVLDFVRSGLSTLPLTVSRQSGACLCLPSGAAGGSCSLHTRRPAAEVRER